MSSCQLFKKPELWGTLLCFGLSFVTSSLVALGLLTLFVYILIFVLCPRSAQRKPLGSTLLVCCFIWLGSLPLMLGQVSGDGFGWGITHEGVQLAFRVGLRAMCAFGAVRLLLILVPFYEFTREMRRLGVSVLVVDLLELSYRYINILMQSAEQIRLAQLSRLGYMGGYRERLGQAALLCSRTFVLAHSSASQVYDGLLSRGFEESGGGAASSLASPVSTTASLLQVRELSFAYNAECDALSSITLSVKAGERIVLLGENGAGKSTLMRILSGLQAGYTGQIELHGEPISSDKHAARRLRSHIALVFQNSNHQLFCPTVEDELSFGLRNLGYSQEEIDQQVAETIARYELESIRHKAPHELSEGQKKWACLAAVLVTNPSVILLDEPTAALDRYYTRKVLALLQELSHRGKTIVLSTHDMHLADQWAVRAWVMSRGQLIADTPVRNLWQQTEILQRANLESPRQFVAAPKPREWRDGAGSYKLLLAHSARLRACVVGAGRGGLRKAKTLLEAQIHCTIISPTAPSQEMMCWIESGQLSWQVEHWTLDSSLPLDIDLVVAATDSEALNEDIARKADLRGLLYCSLSNRNVGNIQFLAQGGDRLRVGVHSDYQLPELMQSLRDRALQSLDALAHEDLLQLSELRRRWLRTRDAQDNAMYEAAQADIIKKYLQANHDRTNRD